MWNENKVRIIDIAEELGVSTATVSNVIHGKTKKISDKIKAKAKVVNPKSTSSLLLLFFIYFTLLFVIIL